MKKTLKLGFIKPKLGLFVLGLGVLAGLLLYKLGSLTHGLSFGEQQISVTPIGWHGLYHQPFYLPLKFLWSIVFYLTPHHSAFLLRLPNALIGFVTIVCFSVLIYLWHGSRTSLLATALLATSAWFLHIARLASYDVLYLFGIISLMTFHVLVYRYGQRFLIWLAYLFLWGLLLTLPGFVYLVLIDMIFQRKVIRRGLKHFKSFWQRGLSLILPILWLPLIGLRLVHHHSGIKTWLGVPAHLPTLHEFAKQFVAVPVHLFVRGPEYPQLWLGKAPLLDALTLILVILGLYLFVQNIKTSRVRQLLCLFVISWLLTALGGPVFFSLCVGLIYIVAATGLAYLIHDWLKIFPVNPLARSLGVGLVALVVVFACLYNLRAYFIAWPNSSITRSSFRLKS